MTTLIVFDCFGTVVNRQARPHLPQADAFAAALSPTLAAAAIDAAHEIRDALTGSLIAASGHQPPTVELFEIAHQRRGMDITRERARALAEQVFAGFSKGASLVPGTVVLLRALCEAGHCVRMSSNCFPPGSIMDGLLARLGILAFFAARFWSSEIGCRKPAPRAFELAGAGPFERRIMVGDSEPIDLRPARELGWDTVKASPSGGYADAVWRLL